MNEANNLPGRRKTTPGKYKETDKRRVALRLSASQRSVLELMMKREGISEYKEFFIKHALGSEFVPKNGAEKAVLEPVNQEAEIRDIMLSLADSYIYIKQRYNKDMTQLYKEGKNLNEWDRKTGKWHKVFLSEMEELFSSVAAIVKEFHMDGFFTMQSDTLAADAWDADKATRDSVAHQLRRESIALGYGDIVKR